jgi:hypothetical protein
MPYCQFTGGESFHFFKIMTSFSPQIGDQCNWAIWTDVEPCTVIERTPKSCKVRVNKTEIAQAPKMVAGGFAAVVTEPAKWRILDEMESRVLTFTLRKSGGWKLQGTKTNQTGNVLRAGHYKHYDYGF